MAQSTPIEIGLLLYPGVQMSAALGLTDLFGIADRLCAVKAQAGDAPWLRISQWTYDDASARMVRTADTVVDGQGKPDVLILPPSLDGPISAESSKPFTGWLRECHDDGAVVASVCVGAFLLAETGLLTGRMATTHWKYDEAFRERFPTVNLDTDRLIIDDGDIITAGGLLAWTDLGLKLVDRFMGPTVMAETAQVLLVDPPGREQSYYSTFVPRLGHGDAAILRVQHWLQATQAKDTDLARLADQAGLETRTLLRRFQKATGLTTTEYCQSLRVGHARELLQFGSLSVDAIGWQVGYGDGSAFRKVFQRLVGLSPSEYRRRFRRRQRR